MRTLRRIIQTASLLLFLFLLSLAGNPTGLDAIPVSDLLATEIPWPVEIYLQMSPLLALAALLGTGTLPPGFLYALVILVSAMLLGRLFCGWLCPLGVLLTLFSQGKKPVRREQLRKRELNPPSHPGRDTGRPGGIASKDGTASRSAGRAASGKRRFDPLALKYLVLLFLIPAAIFSLPLIGVLDPISLFTRSLGVGINPAYNELGQGALDLWYHVSDAVADPSTLPGKAAAFASLHFLSTHRPVFYQAPLLAMLFLFVVFLSRQRIRFWCRYLCPLGALLGLCAKTSALTLHEDSDRCTKCGKCTRSCPAAATPWPSSEWKRSECWFCWNCVTDCRDDALSFGSRWPSAAALRRATEPRPKKSPATGKSAGLPKPVTASHGGKVDLTRRAVTFSVGAGLAAPWLLKGGIGPDGLHPLLIRPPGSLAEQAFLETCIRCGLCMKACITNVIQPTLFEARLEGLWTPRLVMKLGYCEFNCSICGQVCPTGAIEELTLTEKRVVKIGTAFIRPDRCLPYAFQKQCIVCEEHCPTPKKAIYFVEEEVELRDGSRRVLKMPRVDPELCTGCGICENKCPVTDRPAIYVTRAGESRGGEGDFLLKGGQGPDGYGSGSADGDPYGFGPSETDLSGSRTSTAEPENSPS